MKTGRKAAITSLALMLILALGAAELNASLLGPGRVVRKRLSSSVVQITVYDWRGVFVRQGWGFFINQEGHVITPRNLLEGGFYVEVTTVTRESFLVNRIYAEDVEGNFIRLGLEFKPDRFAYLEKSAPLPAVGERVLVGGGMGCEPGAFLDGQIEDIRNVPLFGSLIRIASPFATTGSPVFNEKGVLAAVVMFRLEGGAGDAWAVPVGRIAKVMTDRSKPANHLAWAEKRHGNWGETTVGSYIMGLAYYWSGQYGPAIHRLMRATRDERFRREAFFLLGCCNDAIGHHKASVDSYSMAIRLGDASHDTLLRLAKAYQLEGAYQKAVDTVWASVRVKPDSYDAYILLAELYNVMGDYTKALAGVYVALEMDLTRAEGYHQLGITLMGQQKYQRAIEALKKCIEMDPKSSQAYWHLALTYYRSGDRASAAEICERLKKVDPELSRQLLTRVNP